MAKLRDYLSLTRPETLLAPLILSVLFGWLAIRQTGLVLDQVNILKLAGSAVCLATLNGISNVANQIADVRIDRRSKPHRALPSGRVTLHQAISAMAIGYALALVLAFLLSTLMGLFVALILIATVTYSFPPRLKAKLWIGNISVAGPRGALGLLAAYSAFALPWRIDIMYFALAMAMLAMVQSIIKDFGADEEADKQFGVQTLPNTYGHPTAQSYALAFGFFGSLMIVLGVLNGVLPWSALWALPGGILCCIAPYLTGISWRGDNNLGWGVSYAALGVASIGFVMPQL